MKIEKTYNTSYFLNICEVLEYKELDEKEAYEFIHEIEEFNNKNKYIYKLLKSVKNRWASHYIIRDKNNDIVCTFTIDTSNTLHYFVTKKLTKNNTISFIKTLKKIAIDEISIRNVLFVTTKNWYSQAIKFVKLIGFKKFQTFNGISTTTWYLSNFKGY